MRSYIVLSALLVCAGCGDDTTSGPDLSAPADLAPGADIAVRMPNGVACGTMSCPVGQSCCVTTSGNMATGATCISSTGQCSGGNVLSCDGPEDCSAAGTPLCCATINFTATAPDGGTPTVNGGAAMCTPTCDFAIGATSVTTRLCHGDADCAGLMLPIGNMQTQCCSSTMAPGLHFCAAPVGVAGITCP